MKVAVLGTEKIILGAVCETAVEHGDFNSFDLKYRSNGSHQRIPAPVPPEIYKQIQEDAVTVFKGMRCAGLARVDFFLRGDEIIFNEINTMPGIAFKSIFPRMLDKIGICYPDMIDILIEDALSRAE